MYAEGRANDGTRILKGDMAERACHQRRMLADLRRAHGCSLLL